MILYKYEVRRSVHMDSNELAKFIGGKIKYYRKKMNLTQKQLGDKIGVKHNTMSDYERGYASPEQDTLFKLSDIFGVKIDDLFPQKENTTNELERALRMTEGLNIKDVEFLNQLIEKTLSLSDEEREKFLESIRFTVAYHENMNNNQ